MRPACIVCDRPLKPAGKCVPHCTYCGEVEPSDFTCREQHYVRETCRVARPTSPILRTCIAPTTRDPFAVADLLMKHPAIGPAGLEHHLIVPTVLLVACRNAGLPGISEMNLRLALRCAAVYHSAPAATSRISYLPNLEA